MKPHDEKPTNKLSVFPGDGYLFPGLHQFGPIWICRSTHKIFLAQFDTIKKLASEESCVIIGRCADYALADFPHVVTVFITGDDDVRIRTLMDRHQISESKAKETMIKTDKRRASYYNYYSISAGAISRATISA